MKHSLLILALCALGACRSSYDEKRAKPEVGPNANNSASGPAIDGSGVNTNLGQGSNGTGTTTDPGTTTDTQTNPNQNPNQNTSVLDPSDPSFLAVVHDASPEELKKYNCKGTAVITDSGRDANGDAVLQDSEIRETRIDCTEVVPAKP